MVPEAGIEHTPSHSQLIGSCSLTEVVVAQLGKEAYWTSCLKAKSIALLPGTEKTEPNVGVVILWRILREGGEEGLGRGVSEEPVRFVGILLSK